MCGPVSDGMHVLSRAGGCREAVSSDHMCTPLERQLPAVFVTLTHGETGQNPTESDIVHLVHAREYGCGTDGRVSDGQRSNDRHADRRWLDGHVGRGPTGRRPDARFMLWGSHELGRAGPDTATAIRAGSILPEHDMR